MISAEFSVPMTTVAMLVFLYLENVAPFPKPGWIPHRVGWPTVSTLRVAVFGVILFTWQGTLPAPPASHCGYVLQAAV